MLCCTILTTDRGFNIYVQLCMHADDVYFITQLEIKVIQVNLI